MLNPRNRKFFCVFFGIFFSGSATKTIISPCGCGWRDNGEEVMVPDTCDGHVSIDLLKSWIKLSINGLS